MSQGYSKPYRLGGDQSTGGNTADNEGFIIGLSSSNTTVDIPSSFTRAYRYLTIINYSQDSAVKVVIEDVDNNLLYQLANPNKKVTFDMGTEKIQKVSFFGAFGAWLAVDAANPLRTFGATYPDPMDAADYAAIDAASNQGRQIITAFAWLHNTYLIDVD